jgi:hypothetical protein
MLNNRLLMMVINDAGKSGVARWFIFRPKIVIWVHFGGSCNGRRCWCILWPFGLFYGHLIYFMDLWYRYFVVIWYFFPPFWYIVQRKIWQPWARVHFLTKERFPVTYFYTYFFLSQLIGAYKSRLSSLKCPSSLIRHFTRLFIAFKNSLKIDCQR